MEVLAARIHAAFTGVGFASCDSVPLVGAERPRAKSEPLLRALEQVPGALGLRRQRRIHGA